MSESKSGREYQRDTLRGKTDDELEAAYVRYERNYREAYSAGEKRIWQDALMDCREILAERGLLDEAEKRQKQTKTANTVR